VKESVGHVIHNHKMEEDGKAQRCEGKTEVNQADMNKQHHTGDLDQHHTGDPNQHHPHMHNMQDKIHHVGEDIKEKAHHAADKVEGAFSKDKVTGKQY